ncbi:MAG: hypothetical protein AAGA58_05520 [Verrucomicrobiota bacterium]
MRRFSLFLLFAFFGGLSASQGMIILLINTSNQTFGFSGSDTGEVLNAGGVGAVNWDTGNLGGSGDGSVFDATRTMFSVNPGTPVGLPGSSDDEDVFVSSIAFGSGTVEVGFFVSETSGTVTVTGENVFRSYASMGAGPIARFEGLIGANIPITADQDGLGFSPIQVQLIPEPSVAVLGVMGVLVMGWRRRRG